MAKEVTETEETEEEKKDKKEDKDTEENAPAGEAVAAPAGKKKKIILLALVVILVLGGGAGAYFFFKNKNSAVAEKAPETGHAKPKASEKHGGSHGSEPVDETGSAFYDMEEFIVNLTNGNKSAFLKLVITLQVPKAVDSKVISEKLPIIRDNFQIFLRELRPIDLQGSNGVYKIKEELLLRINKILAPIQVEDILLKNILVTS